VLLRSSKGYGWYKKYMEKGPEAFTRNVPPTPFDWSTPQGQGFVRPKAYFDLSVEKQPLGRLTFELASDVVPVAVRNFLRLCLGEGSKYSYKGTKIHRVHKNVALMGGDVEKNDGSGNFSSFGKRHFADENFIIPHSSRGLISMASVGLDTNGSQFYISFSPTTHMNGRCQVFGRIIGGEEHLKTIEEAFTFRGVPASDIVIAECGAVDHDAFLADESAENVYVSQSA
jgi:cyclophilin family peptidyl-prolyl cis-trans isomerase